MNVGKAIVTAALSMSLLAMPACSSTATTSVACDGTIYQVIDYAMDNLKLGETPVVIVNGAVDENTEINGDAMLTIHDAKGNTAFCMSHELLDCKVGEPVNVRGTLQEWGETTLLIWDAELVK